MNKFLKVFSVLFLFGAMFAGCGGSNNNCNNGGINTSQWGCVNQGSCSSGYYQTPQGCLSSQQVAQLSGSSYSCTNGYTQQNLSGMTMCCLPNVTPSMQTCVQANPYGSTGMPGMTGVPGMPGTIPGMPGTTGSCTQPGFFPYYGYISSLPGTQHCCNQFTCMY